MNKKFSLGITISLVAIACAITFVITWSVSLSNYNSKIAGVNEREEIYSKLQEVDSYVRNNYLGTIDESTLVESIMDGYIKGINDKYASYMTADEYYSNSQTEKGIMMGIGLGVTKAETGYLRITQIYAGSSAASTDIAVGDEIVAVGTQNILEIGADEAAKLFAVNEGESVTFTVRHDGEDKAYTLTAKTTDIVSVIFDEENGIGYIRISSFNSMTETQFSEAIDNLLARDVKGFVFDVRENGGGLVSSVQGVLNRLIGEQTIATARYKDGTEKDLVVTDSEQSVDLPMTVLVDSYTVSSAEIFAMALRDFKGAQLVGQTTYGKAVIQVTQSFTDGTAVKVTVADIIPAKSESYNGTGLKPDYVIEMTSEIETDVSKLSETGDTQLTKAFEIIETLIQTKTAQ